MAQPVKYEREHAFQQDELGRQDGAALDQELDNAAESINQIRHNLALIQTDEGGLQPGLVGVEQLTDEAVSELQQGVAEKAAELDAAVQEAQDAANTAVDAANRSTKLLEETSTLTADLIGTGKEQVEYVKSYVVKEQTNLANGCGVLCNEQVWTVTEALESGATITLPNSMKYIVGRHHLRLTWNGLDLIRLYNYEEIGDEFQWSTDIKLLFPLKEGDEMKAWTAALGIGDLTELIPQINTVQNAILDLSDRVVYRDEDAAEGFTDTAGNLTPVSYTISSKLDTETYEQEKKEAYESLSKTE